MPRQRRLGFLQKLQPRILLFTFGASLLPVIVLVSAAWQFVHQPLIDLEKTRLDDQVLAFRGYTDAAEKATQNLAISYSWSTDLVKAIERRDRTWLNKEVCGSLLITKNTVNAVKVVNNQGETLAERGDALRAPIVQQQITALIKTQKSAHQLLDTGNYPSLSKNLKHTSSVLGDNTRPRHLLLLWIGPITYTDGKGKPAGTLMFSQLLDQSWLSNFINFSQPTTKLKIISLDGKLITSSHTDTSTDAWETTYFAAKVLPAIQQGRSVYRIEAESRFNTVYAPINSQGKPMAIVKIQISSGYFQQALVALNRLAWVGLGLATLLSVAIAQRLAKQIAQPINQLAERSKTLAAGDLSAPIPGVGSGGELGQLANAYQEMAYSLKALIGNLEQRVAKRTQELELARQTLEERVEQRTEELWQKNNQLQQAHDTLHQLNAELTSKAEQLSKALSQLKRAQAQLIQTEKMSSLGQLVAGIAHEFNNPISFIYGNLTYVSRYTQDLLELVQVYQQRYPDPEIQKHTEVIELDFLIEDLPQVLSSMKTGADRICNIVLSLQTFSRLDQAGMKPVDIHEGLNSALLILQHRLKTNNGCPDIQLIKQYGDLPLVECYPSQLNQVFMNILTNAIDALENSKQQLNKQILIQTELTASKQIRISISDNGPGIPTEIQSKVFDPFFTTKPVGQKTGLGLSVAYQILAQHEGHIQVISEPGQGTEVVIELPQEVKRTD